jgi:HPt (histidine-containing phosphotransfer) domain-containing protein
MDYKFINTEYLYSVTAGDPDITRDIINMFKSQSIEIHTEMETRFSRKDYQYLGQLAHKAKSSVAIMGMNDLATMLRNFELQAKEGKETERYESYIQRFKTETDSAVYELEDYVNKL